MDFHQETPECDFEDCSNPGDRLMVVDGQPAALLCTDCMHQVERQTEAGTHKVSLDIHLHRHAIVSLVNETVALGEQYAEQSAAAVQ